MSKNFIEECRAIGIFNEKQRVDDRTVYVAPDNNNNRTRRRIDILENELRILEKSKDVEVFIASISADGFSKSEEEEERFNTKNNDNERNREEVVAYRVKIWAIENFKDGNSNTKKTVLFENEDEKKKGLLLARVDEDPNRTSDGFQLRGLSITLAIVAMKEKNNISNKLERKIKVIMTPNAAFKHASMNANSSLFKNILSFENGVDVNVKCACEATLRETFEIVEIHELTKSFDKNSIDNFERRPKCAILKRVVVKGESWETPSDFSEVSLRVRDISKNELRQFILKRQTNNSDSYENFLMALTRTMRKRETCVALIPKERFVNFSFACSVFSPIHPVENIIDIIRENNDSKYNYEEYVAIEMSVLDWVSARDCFGDGKVIKTVLSKSDPSRSFPTDSPVQDTKVYISNLSVRAKTTIDDGEILLNGNESSGSDGDISFRLGSGEMPRALETALRTSCVGETIRVTVNLRDEDETKFARKQRKQMIQSYLHSNVLLGPLLLKLISREEEKEDGQGDGNKHFRVQEVTFECKLSAFDTLVNWYSDSVSLCLDDGQKLKSDANNLFKREMFAEALEKYETIAQKLNHLASRAALEEEQEQEESQLVTLLNNVYLNAAITAKKLKDYPVANKNLEKIPEEQRSFKAKVLKGRIFIDESEFKSAKKTFQDLLIELEQENKEENGNNSREREEVEQELLRLKQLEKRALDEMRKSFKGKF
jgi:hypothetical protein